MIHHTPRTTDAQLGAIWIKPAFLLLQQVAAS